MLPSPRTIPYKTAVTVPDPPIGAGAPSLGALRSRGAPPFSKADGFCSRCCTSTTRIESKKLESHRMICSLSSPKELYTSGRRSALEIHTISSNNLASVMKVPLNRSSSEAKASGMLELEPGELCRGLRIGANSVFSVLRGLEGFRNL